MANEAKKASGLLRFFPPEAEKQSGEASKRCVAHRLYFASLRYTSGVLCGGDAMRSKAYLGGA
jgi:hypothetical protein